MRIKTKRKGVILLEALFAILLLGMVSYGFAATSTLQFQQLDAVKVAAQAKDYAEVEAKYVQALGYYDVEAAPPEVEEDKKGIHDRKTMEWLIGEDDGANWSSVTKVVSEKKLPGFDEDEDENKVKIVSIDVYRKDETMPRFSLSVPLSLQDSSYGVPIGTVMAWPLDSAPRGLHRDRWLECNGQSVDSNKYPRLAKLMSNVPDYRGMFLRGLGYQDYTQNNGVKTGYTSTRYSSSSLGETQGDSIRNIQGQLGGQVGGGNPTPGYDSWEKSIYGVYLNPFYYDITQSYNSASVSFPGVPGYHSGGERTRSFGGGGWYEALTKYEYIPHISYGQAGDISYVSDISFEVNEIHPELQLYNPIIPIAFSTDIVVPTANENRPVNKAVRYMIKAK